MGEETCLQNQEQQQQENVPKFEINQLKVFSPVGRGAKGVVFHVRVENSDEDLALKVVLKSSVSSSRKNNAEKKQPKNSNGFEQSRVFFEQRVLREFDHPLLPKLQGVVETENLFGYAIDYCSGGNLSLLRKQQVEKMFSDDIIRFYGAEMVLALEYLHKKGIVYRDLKPDNILIQDNGHLMLVDFDLSTKLVPISPVTRSRTSHGSIKKPELVPVPRRRSSIPKFYSFCKSGIRPENSFDSGVKSLNSVESTESDSVGKSNSFVGTEEYVAPEIIQGNGHDFAVDWWSLGVVLHEMLYGATPFRGSNRKETFYRILSKTPDLVGETTPLRDLIGKLLQKDPKMRIDLEEIKGHNFFKGVDWEMIVHVERPPFIPERPEVGEGVDGIKAIDVESIVYGILKKEDVHDNNNNNNINNTSADEDANTHKINDDVDDKTSVVDTKDIKKDVWVEGLQRRSVSNDFLVF